MDNEKMLGRLVEAPGFIAGLDDVDASAYGASRGGRSGEEARSNLADAMRLRVVTAPAFGSGKIIAALLPEDALDNRVNGRNLPFFLWDDRGIVPLVTVDHGMEADGHGVSVMKPIQTLQVVLARAKTLGVAGVSTRSVINRADAAGIDMVVERQIEIGGEIARHGLLPILAFEVAISSPEKSSAEAILLRALAKVSEEAALGEHLALSLTLPETPNLYQPLLEHPRVARIVALSGGLPRSEACRRLIANPGLIAGFSGALLEDLRESQTDQAFNTALAQSTEEIFAASVSGNCV